MLIRDILKLPPPQDNMEIKGWIKTARHSKTVSFLEVTDGSCMNGLQVVFTPDIGHYNQLIKTGTGASIIIKGNLTASQGKQTVELQAKEIQVIGDADDTYPLQKKRHSFEFLREIPHLRPKTNTLGAIFRLRSQLSFAIHQFFHNKGFIYLHAPILTGSDCEGAGELFQVTTLKSDDLCGKPDDFTQDFFGQKAYLTVSGQLNAEIFAQSFKNTYTFGPTFRAENSNTSRHCAEFWMIEPEMAFTDLNGNMTLAEELVKYLIQYALDNAKADMEFFNQWVDKELFKRLDNVLQAEFKVVDYTEAVDILAKSNTEFNYPVKWGSDLQTEHERYLCETIFKQPIFVINYPASFKPFYMRVNDDQKTVAAMDVLVPGVGEIIGGSQREERYDILLNRMKEQGLSIDDYQWYLDLRKYGAQPHSGFGLGFERFLMYVTGMENIRDVIPFPRVPKYIKC
ncbi:asparagine--tRNA ligase [Thermoproteota archaeon]